MRSAARKAQPPETRPPPAERFAEWRARKIAELLGGCFPKQRAFIEDAHRAKAVLKTRRAGGSYALAVYHCLNLLRRRRPARPWIARNSFRHECEGQS